MINREIKNLSLILAFATASLYVYGLTFHQGYLRHWGLEESLFSLSFERTLFHGFLASSYLGAKTLGPLLGVSVALFAAMTSFAWLAKVLREKSWYQKRFGERAKKTESGELPNYVQWAALIAAFAYWALVSFLVLMAMLAQAGRMGDTIAADQHARFNESKEGEVSVHLSSGEQFSGFAITCSSEHCAFLVNQAVKMYPLSSILLVESVPKKA